MIKLAEIKQHLGITTTEFDAYLADREAAAVAFMETQTREYFGPIEQYTEVVVGRGRDTLTLRYPIADVAEPTITVSEIAFRGDTPVVIEPDATDGWEVDGWQLARIGGYGWTRGYRYTVTYPRGYAPGAEPEDVREAVLNLVEYAWNHRGHAGMQSESIGGYSYRIASLDEIPRLRETIRAHRRPVVA